MSFRDVTGVVSQTVGFAQNPIGSVLGFLGSKVASIFSDPNEAYNQLYFQAYAERVKQANQRYLRSAKYRRAFGRQMAQAAIRMRRFQ